MENRGVIKEGLLPYLFMDLDRKKWTGVLFVEREKRKKEFYIKNGCVGYSKSNLLSETLGRVMLSNGLIKISDHQRALEIMKEKGVKLGTALKEIGYKEDISNALKLQLETRVKELFLWKDGRWEILDKKIDEDKFPFWAETDMVYLISKGISIMDETFFIRNREKFLSSIYVMGIKDNRVRVPLSLEEILKGKLSGRDFIRAIGDDEKGLRVLYFYEVVGIIKMVKESKEKKEEVSVIPEEKEMYDKLLERFNFLKSASFFERLGVKRDAGINEIKEKYYALAREFHPDRFHNFKSDVIRDIADRVFTLINDAYSTLSDPQKRDEYEFFYDESASFRIKEKEDVVSAEIQFQKAEVLEKKGNLKEALEFYKWACKLNPKESLYLAKVGWTAFRLGKRNGDLRMVEEGKKDLFKAYSLSSQSDTITYLVASLYRAEGDYKKTVEFLEKTLSLNPLHEGAKREINFFKRKEKM